MKTINDINTEHEHGKLLLAAIAKITTESQTDKTLDQVLYQLNRLSKKMFKSKKHIHTWETGFGYRICNKCGIEQYVMITDKPSFEWVTQPLVKSVKNKSRNGSCT